MRKKYVIEPDSFPSNKTPFQKTTDKILELNPGVLFDRSNLSGLYTEDKMGGTKPMKEMAEKIIKLESKLLDIIKKFEQEEACCFSKIELTHDSSGEIPQTNGLKTEIVSAMYGKNLIRFM